MTDDTLFCSFCGKRQSQVSLLVAGPTVFICDECVELCNDIVDHEKGATRPIPLRPIERTTADEFLAHCLRDGQWHTEPSIFEAGAAAGYSADEIVRARIRNPRIGVRVIGDPVRRWWQLPWGVSE